METILCAATWYKDLPLVKDFENNMRPINCDRGVVFCGLRHTQCLYTKCAVTGLKDSESGEYIQGFLTSKNRFVDREEAWKITNTTGQRIQQSGGFGTLYSEDLY